MISKYMRYNIDRQTDRQMALYGLKGILCLGIVMTHYPRSFDNVIMNTIMSSGARGVQLFFVISGFLSFFSLSKIAKGGVIDVRRGFRWFAKRIIRLLPLYYLSIFLSLAMGTYSSTFMGNRQMNIGCILLHFLFIHGFFPYYTNCLPGGEWYIGVLVVFYMIAPWLFNRIKTLGRASFFLMSSLFFSYLCQKVIRYLFIDILGEYVIGTYIQKWSLVGEMPLLLIGIVLYFAIEKATNNKTMAWAMRGIGIFLTFSMIFADNSINVQFSYFIWGIICAIIIFSFYMYRDPILESFVLRKIGELSYPIYLMQFIVIPMVSNRVYSENVYYNYIIGLLVTIIVLIVLSYILISFYDTPIKKSKLFRIVRTDQL